MQFSFVFPVYNKAAALPALCRSLRAQQQAGTCEFIFVDDASSDDSCAVIHEQAQALDNVQLIENADNAGPSVRINQGAAAARGEFLLLFDSDEVLAPDATAVMAALARQHDADMVHGRWRHTDQPPDAIKAAAIGAGAPHQVHAVPLDRVLAGGLVRMTWLVRRGLFERAGGCDEGVFIQDEALPLRLALAARRLVELTAPVTWVPAGGTHLSDNLPQQHHDRFLAYHRFATAHGAALTAGQRRAIALQLNSSYWKSWRDAPAAAGRGRAFWRYLVGKLVGGRLGRRRIDDYAAYFRALPGVRRGVSASCPGSETAPDRRSAP